jgi:hypothetical protein
MVIARTILASVVILCAAYIAVMNWGCVIQTWRNERKGIKRYHSTVPLGTFFLAVVALLLWPFEPRLWILIIPLADIGNLNLLISLLYFPIYLLRNRHADRKDPP